MPSPSKSPGRQTLADRLQRSRRHRNWANSQIDTGSVGGASVSSAGNMSTASEPSHTPTSARQRIKNKVAHLATSSSSDNMSVSSASSKSSPEKRDSLVTRRQRAMELNRRRGHTASSSPKNWPSATGSASAAGATKTNDTLSSNTKARVVAPVAEGRRSRPPATPPKSPCESMLYQASTMDSSDGIGSETNIREYANADAPSPVAVTEIAAPPPSHSPARATQGRDSDSGKFSFNESKGKPTADPVSSPADHSESVSRLVSQERAHDNARNFPKSVSNLVSSRSSQEHQAHLPDKRISELSSDYRDENDLGSKLSRGHPASHQTPQHAKGSQSRVAPSHFTNRPATVTAAGAESVKSVYGAVIETPKVASVASLRASFNSRASSKPLMPMHSNDPRVKHSLPPVSKGSRLISKQKEWSDQGPAAKAVSKEEASPSKTSWGRATNRQGLSASVASQQQPMVSQAADRGAVQRSSWQSHSIGQEKAGSVLDSSKQSWRPDGTQRPWQRPVDAGHSQTDSYSTQKRVSWQSKVIDDVGTSEADRVDQRHSRYDSAPSRHFGKKASLKEAWESRYQTHNEDSDIVNVPRSERVDGKHDPTSHILVGGASSQVQSSQSKVEGEPPSNPERRIVDEEDLAIPLHLRYQNADRKAKYLPVPIRPHQVQAKAHASAAAPGASSTSSPLGRSSQLDPRPTGSPKKQSSPSQDSLLPFILPMSSHKKSFPPVALPPVALPQNAPGPTLPPVALPQKSTLPPAILPSGNHATKGPAILPGNDLQNTRDGEPSPSTEKLPGTGGASPVGGGNRNETDLDDSSPGEEIDAPDVEKQIRRPPTYKQSQDNQQQKSPWQKWSHQQSKSGDTGADMSHTADPYEEEKKTPDMTLAEYDEDRILDLAAEETLESKHTHLARLAADSTLITDYEQALEQASKQLSYDDDDSYGSGGNASAMPKELPEEFEHQLATSPARGGERRNFPVSPENEGTHKSAVSSENPEAHSPNRIHPGHDEISKNKNSRVELEPLDIPVDGAGGPQLHEAPTTPQAGSRYPRLTPSPRDNDTYRTVYFGGDSPASARGLQRLRSSPVKESGNGSAVHARNSPWREDIEHHREKARKDADFESDYFGQDWNQSQRPIQGSEPSRSAAGHDNVLKPAQRNAMSKDLPSVSASSLGTGRSRSSEFDSSFPDPDTIEIRSDAGSDALFGPEETGTGRASAKKPAVGHSQATWDEGRFNREDQVSPWQDPKEKGASQVLKFWTSGTASQEEQEEAVEFNETEQWLDRDPDLDGFRDDTSWSEPEEKAQAVPSRYHAKAIQTRKNLQNPAERVSPRKGNTQFQSPESTTPNSRAWTVSDAFEDAGTPKQESTFGTPQHGPANGTSSDVFDPFGEDDTSRVANASDLFSPLPDPFTTEESFSPPDWNTPRGQMNYFPSQSPDWTGVEI